MGLLEDAERRRADGLRWQQRLLLVSAQGVFLLIVAAFLLFLAVAAVVMVAVEFGHWGYLAWAGRHPALVARYDPHHWLSRAVALVALLSLAHAVCRGLSEMLRRQLPALWSAVFSEGLPMLRACGGCSCPCRGSAAVSLSHRRRERNRLRPNKALHRTDTAALSCSSRLALLAVPAVELGR